MKGSCQSFSKKTVYNFFFYKIWEVWLCRNIKTVIAFVFKRYKLAMHSKKVEMNSTFLFSMKVKNFLLFVKNFPIEIGARILLIKFSNPLETIISWCFTLEEVENSNKKNVKNVMLFFTIKSQHQLKYFDSQWSDYQNRVEIVIIGNKVFQLWLFWHVQRSIDIDKNIKHQFKNPIFRNLILVGAYIYIYIYALCYISRISQRVTKLEEELKNVQ